MEGRTLRARAPVNYKGEEGGTNTPGWLKASSRFSVGNATAETTAKSDTNKENAARIDSPTTEGKSSPLAGQSVVQPPFTPKLE